MIIGAADVLCARVRHSVSHVAILTAGGSGSVNAHIDNTLL